MSASSDQVGVGLCLVPIEQRGFHINGLVPGGAAERSGQVRIGDVLVGIEGRDVRAAPIDRVKQMILGAPGSMLRLLVLRNSKQGQSPVAISLQRSKPVATTNAMPPSQPQPPQLQGSSARDQLSQSQSRASFRSDNEPSSLYGTRMSVSGDATRCGVGLGGPGQPRPVVGHDHREMPEPPSHLFRMWMWEDDAGTQWLHFDLADAQFLEAAFQRNEVAVHHPTRPWSFNLIFMTQTNFTSGYKRRIRRDVMSSGYEASLSSGEHKKASGRAPNGAASVDRPRTAPAPHSTDWVGQTTAKTNKTFSLAPSGHATQRTPPAPPPHLSPASFDASSRKAGRGDGAVSSSKDKASPLLQNSASVHQRSSLVAQEPLRIINPIQSFFRDLRPPGKAMTLAKSLKPVIDAIESGQITNLNLQDLRMAIDRCHNNGVDVKRFRQVSNPSPLTVAGIASINLYTGEFGSPAFYAVLNTTLRDAKREQCRPFVPYIWLLMHALRDCPRYEMRLVFRGVLGVNLSSQYPKGREVTWYQFSSCTCDLSVEQSDRFCGSKGIRTLFTIELTTGRARIIDQYSLEPSEAEVMLPLNSRFRVKGILNAGNGLTQIQLEELPCLEPILDFGDISAAVGAPVPPHARVVGGHAAVVSSAQVEDPEVAAFARSLKALSVGTAEICLKFAKALGALGILSVDKLKTLPLKQAESYLKRVQMTDVQIATVMAVVMVHAQAAAAAARIVGNPDILAAAKLGNVALVKDHVLTDPACVNKRSGSQMTPLMKAACNNHLEVCKVLLESNADVNARIKNQNTSLNLAAIYGHVEVCKLLVAARANLSLKSRSGKTALKFAIENRKSSVADYLRSIKAPQ